MSEDVQRFLKTFRKFMKAFLSFQESAGSTRRHTIEQDFKWPCAQLPRW